MANAKGKEKEKEVQETQADQGEQTAKRKFGVTSETKSKNLVPFQPTEENPITLGRLAVVKKDERELKKTGEKVPVLVFEFKDVEGARTHFHTEWRVDDDDQDFDVKKAGMESRIKHIYEEHQVLPVDGLGNGAESWEEFFEAVALAFNENGKDKTPVFKDSDAKPVAIWIKVSYNIKSGVKAQLGFPLSPNFIERFKQGKKTTLAINKRYETLKQPEGATARGPLPSELGAANVDVSGEFPKFPGQQ